MPAPTTRRRRRERAPSRPDPGRRDRAGRGALRGGSDAGRRGDPRPSRLQRRPSPRRAWRSSSATRPRCAPRRARRRRSRPCSGRARCSRCAASASITCRSGTTGASAAASCGPARCGAPRSPPTKRPQLLAVLRFVRETPGGEALGIGLAAALPEGGAAEAVRGAGGAEALDALGTMADRLAQRASSGAAPQADGSARPSRDGARRPSRSRRALRRRVHELRARRRACSVCYDGEAFRRVLAMPRAEPGAARPRRARPDAARVHRPGAAA